MKMIRRLSIALALFSILSAAKPAVLAEAATVTTFDDLLSEIEAVPDDGTETVLKINDNITLSSALPIKKGQNITVMSAGDASFTLAQANGRHFNVDGSLTLANIVLDGGTTGGGVEVVGSFLMMEGAVIRNCSANHGGGVHVDSRGNFSMEGGTIDNNKAMDGGGVFVIGGAADITGGAIVNNTATANNKTALGGGIFVSSDGTVNVAGTVNISGNKAVGDNATSVGGGICANNSIVTIQDNVRITGNEAGNASGKYGLGGGIYATSSTVDLSGNVKIDSNKAIGSQGFGGGIFLYTEDTSSDVLTIIGGVEISGNVAGDEGGGIYTADSTYSNLSADMQTVFAGNSASSAYAPPEDALQLYPNIQFASVSIASHPLNNYDINYSSGDLLTYTVTYAANGGAGSHSVADIIPGGTHTVLTPDETGISRANYTFTCWNTKTDGTGTSYVSGGEVTVNGNVTLYAQWREKLEKGYHFAYLVGYPEGDIRPDRNITRAEAASIFFRLLTQDYRTDIWSKMNDYPDVNAGDWYNNAISTLTNGGILSGYPDGFFDPASSITRAEFASIAARFAAETDTDSAGSSSAFSDISGHWAKSHIDLAAALGYVSGYEDGTFRPDNPITRAEVAALLNRVLNRHVESEDDLLGGMVTWSDNISGKWYYFAIQEATNSHYYERKADGINELWTSLQAVPDWSVLEAPDAEPGDISN